MINNLIKTYALKRATSLLDDYGQEIQSDYSTIQDVRISVVYSEEIAKDNPQFSEVKYIGTYYGKAVEFKKQDRLDDKYEICEVIKAGRLVYLYLKDV